LYSEIDLLGIGRENLIGVKTCENNKVDVNAMREKALELESQGIKVMAIVGVAGTTETGNIDPLDDMADLAQQITVIFTLMQRGVGQRFYRKRIAHY
jgi:glutamate decarboxylase